MASSVWTVKSVQDCADGMNVKHPAEPDPQFKEQSVVENLKLL